MILRRWQSSLALFGDVARFVLDNFGRLLLWGLPIPLYGLALELSETAEGGAAEPSHLGLALGLGLTLLGLLLVVPLQFNVQRHLLTGAPLDKPPYLTLFASGAVWRYAALLLALTGAVAILLAASGALLYASIETHPGDFRAISAAPMIGSFALFALTIYLGLKASVAPALLAEGDAHPIRGSWEATRGGLTRLLSLYSAATFSFLVMIFMVGFALGIGSAIDSALDLDIPQAVSDALLVVAWEIFTFALSVTLATIPCVYLCARDEDAQRPFAAGLGGT